MMSAIKNNFYQGLLDPKEGIQLPAAMLCVPSKIQIRQWFEDYYSKISCHGLHCQYCRFLRILYYEFCQVP